MTRLEEQLHEDHRVIRDFYDKTYYSEDFRDSLLPWQVKRVASRFGNMQGLRVLDVACGTGQWLEELGRRGAALAGVDISAKAVAAARSRLRGAELHEGTAEELPFPDSWFDVVTCMGSLEHFIDQKRALEEMRRVAKPGARFLILVPNAGFLTRRIGLYGGTGQAAIRETVKPLQEWQGLLESAGLRVVTRWRDLHPLSVSWITLGPAYRWPLRAVQALALATWPLSWQYQVYFLCNEAVKPHRP